MLTAAEKYYPATMVQAYLNNMLSLIEVWGNEDWRDGVVDLQDKIYAMTTPALMIPRAEVSKEAMALYSSLTVEYSASCDMDFMRKLSLLVDEFF